MKTHQVWALLIVNDIGTIVLALNWGQFDNKTALEFILAYFIWSVFISSSLFSLVEKKSE